MNKFELNLKKFLKDLRLKEEFISRILGFAVVIIVGLLIYNYFAGINRKSEEFAMQENPILNILPETHTVNTGEHLWNIAEKYYKSGYNWIDIAKVNNLSNPDLLIVGQELIIPDVDVRTIKTENTQIAGANISRKIITTDKYIVEKGDSLWEIAVRSYQDGYRWIEIWEANKGIILNPGLIEIGMELSLPR